MRLAPLPLLLFAALGSRPAAAEELFNEKIAVLEEFPRELGRGKSLTLKGMRKGAHKAPSLIVIAPNGRTTVCLDKRVEESRFEFDLEFKEGVGPYRFELMLSSQNRGGLTAARFTIWYGKRKPAVEEPEEPLPTGPPTPKELHPRLVEKRFLARLNEFRRTLKLDPVGWNEAAAARARDHASKMARAKRRVHKFGGRGVRENLWENGAGEWAPYSGPATSWGRVVDTRPFPRPSVEPPGRNVQNHVVQFVLDGHSLTVLFEQYFVREAAHRVLAADPNCTEIGMACAREQEGDPSRLYFCVCFVQVNEKPVVDGLEAAFRRLRLDAKSLEPELVRRLAMWSRPKAAKPIVTAALRDDRADVRAAAIDAWLLLDEESAREDVADRVRQMERDREARKFADAYRAAAALAGVTYDRAIAKIGRDAADAIVAEAKKLRAGIAQLPEDERDAAEKRLERELEGVPGASE